MEAWERRVVCYNALRRMFGEPSHPQQWSDPTHMMYNWYLVMLYNLYSQVNVPGILMCVLVKLVLLVVSTT
jgi:quinol-cytochrome oxidoreductase complex cytochrome b subunit